MCMYGSNIYRGTCDCASGTAPYTSVYTKSLQLPHCTQCGLHYSILEIPTNYNFRRLQDLLHDMWNNVSSLNETNATLNSLDVGLVVTESMFIGITIFFLILMVLLRNRNPLKSRGIVPYAGAVLYILTCIRSGVGYPHMMNAFDPDSITRDWSCFWYHSIYLTIGSCFYIPPQ
jgi:hypothetical protein